MKKLITVVAGAFFLLIVVEAAAQTRPIKPRGNNEGSLGTPGAHWGGGYFRGLSCDTLYYAVMSPALGTMAGADSTNYALRFLKNADSTAIRLYSNALYQPVGNYVTGTPWTSDGYLTAAALTPYALKTDTSFFVMPWELTPYALKSEVPAALDTTSLSARINAKQNVIANLADTSKYYEAGDTPQFKTTRVDTLIFGNGSTSAVLQLNAPITGPITVLSWGNFIGTSVLNVSRVFASIYQQGTTDTMATMAYARAQHGADTGAVVMPWRLAAYQPIGDYVTGTPWTSMGYVLGTPWVDMGYVTGTPWTGMGYLVASDLASYALKTDTANFVMPWELAAYQAAGNYALKTDTSGYVMPWEVADFMAHADTLSLSGRIDLKFNTADTTAFNSKALTSAQLALKQNVIANLADTSLYQKKTATPVVITVPMDSSYINVTDTLVVGSFPYAFTVDSLKFVHQGAGDVTFKVYYGQSLQSWTAVVTAGTQATSNTIGTNTSTLNNASVPANNYIGVACAAVAVKPKQSIVTIFGHQ